MITIKTKLFVICYAMGVIFPIVTYCSFIVIDNINGNDLAKEMNCKNIGSLRMNSEIRVFDCNGEIKLINLGQK